MSIYSLVKQYEDNFLNNSIKIVDGYNFDQLETIKNNQRYYAGKFRNGNEDEFGYKYFQNTIKPKVKNVAKNIDLDTKDVNIKATKPEDYYKAWLMRRDTVLWMKKHKIGKMFNESSIKTPKYGTFVVKKVNSKEIIRSVNLKNIKCDATSECLDLSGWIIEDHYYTPSELKKEVERGWDKDNIDKAIKSYRVNQKENYDDNYSEANQKGNAQYIHIKEFYGDVPENIIDGGNENIFKLYNFIIISPENEIDNITKEKKDGLILYKKPIKSIGEIYKEVHYDREEGRWLGIGIVEDLIDMQIMKNEEINQVMLSIRLANLVLFQTRDETISRNILTDLINGDIVKVKSEITRINTQNVGLNQNQYLTQEIEKTINDLANFYEITTGESLPSGTPFALGALINQNANKFFDFIRENLGIFWQEVFEEWIIPELSEDLNKKHLLEITGKEEMEWVNKQMQKSLIWETIKNFLMAGKIPTVQDIELVEGVLNERNQEKESFFIDTPDDFYNFEKSVSVDFTDERGNKNQLLQTLSTILQMLGTNPLLIDHPILQKILDLSGLSSIDVSQKQVEQQPQNPQIPQNSQVNRMQMQNV